ncbi:MAG: hypothetical protein RMJ48_12060 [Roseiflexaceae bacterium]|nr:hypothetical protein [Roseiflexaceae bacterium]
MRPSPLRLRPSQRMRRGALVALALLTLLAAVTPLTVGASETAPTPPTWLRVNGGAPGLYERFASRHYVGRDTQPQPQVDGRGNVTNRPGPPDNTARVGLLGAGVLANDQYRPDIYPVPGGRLQCPWPWERSRKGFFTYWSGGYWTKFAVWSSQTNHATGQTTWTKIDEVWTFVSDAAGCHDPDYATLYQQPTPTRRPTDPTPTPLPPLTNAMLPTLTPLPQGYPAACNAVPFPLELVLRVSRDNGATWTTYERRHVGWRTDYTLDEYWGAQGGRLTHLDLPDNMLGDVTMRFPHERTWIILQPGDLVEAEFRIDRMDILRGSNLTGAYAAFDANLSGQWRNFRIAIQEMGRDYAPGGNGENADALLMWLAAGTSGYDAHNGPTSDAIEVASRWQDYNMTWQTFRQPLGFQALLDPRVTTNHPPVFTDYSGMRPPDGVGEAQLTRAPWPDEDRNIRYLRPMNGYVHRNGVLAPDGAHPLRFRFRVEAEKMYRMFARTYVRIPGCDREDSWTKVTVSQLAFGAPRRYLPRLDLRIERDGAREIAVGATAEYGITVVNNSQEPITATTTLLTETLPLGLSFVSARDADTNAPLPPQTIWRDGGVQRIEWDLGELPHRAARRVAVIVRAGTDAPDVVRPSARTDPAPPQADENLDNNQRFWELSVLRANVRAGVAAPRLARPGDEFEVTARAIHTTPRAPAREVTLRLALPFGVTLADAGDGAVDGNAVEWRTALLEGGATFERRVRVRALREDEAGTLPAALDFVASVTTAAGYDSNPGDNEARGMTALLVMPRPNGDLRMRIYSEFDRMQQVYRTEGTAFAWPIGETLYFLPEVTLRTPPTPNPPIYAARQRVVAWSFVGSGPLTLGGSACKARETPHASETEHADLSRMRGCAYRYRETAGPSDMLGQGRLYWAAFAPESLAGATYGIWPLPGSPTNLRIQYAVLTELVETGLYDLDGDGRDDSVLDRRTDVLDGTFTVTLVAPRDVR